MWYNYSMPKNKNMASIAIEERERIRRLYVRAQEEPFSEGSADVTQPGSMRLHYEPTVIARITRRGRKEIPALLETIMTPEGERKIYYDVKSGKEVSPDPETHE